MTVQLKLRERSAIQRGDAEVVSEPANLTPTDERALLSSLQVPLPQGTSSLLRAGAPQVTETEPTKDDHSAGRGLPSLVANPLLQLVTAHVEMKSRDLATIVHSFCKSLQRRITPSLLNGARQKVVVSCSELYKIVASFSRSLQGRITPSLIYSARQKVVVSCSELCKIVASFSTSLQGRITPSLIYSARQKVAAASLLLIIIATAVIGTTAGLALGLIKARSNVTSSLRTVKQSVPPNVSLPPATIARAPSTASPANSPDLNNSQVTDNVRTMRANPQPSTVHLNLEAPLKNKDSKSLPPNAMHGDEKMTLHTPLEVKVVEEKPASNPPHRVIAVVVQIEEGRVKEAHIQNPQADLRAFEAMALRRARDRRYPKETKRKETVILHISNQPPP